MEYKVEKFDKYDSDLIRNDIIVLLDQTWKIIKKITDGHHVVFSDGSTIDLFVDEIKGVVKCGYRGINNTNCLDSKPSETVSNNKLKTKYLFTYDELFKTMEDADHSNMGFAKYFWHFTTTSNLIEIIKNGKFRSRYISEGSIPYDQRIHNETTKDVTDNNRSWATERYVRCYLRPLNKPYFSMYKKLPDKEKASFVIVCIRKEALKASFKPTFLYYQNANKAKTDDLNFKNRLNNHADNKIVLNNSNLFNFEETYTIYDKNGQPHSRDLYQEAEFLVFEELSTYFIDKILFRTNDALNFFLECIKDLDTYYNIKSKCVVDRDYFGY